MGAMFTTLPGEQAKVLLASHTGMSVQVLVMPFPSQLPANVPRKAALDGTSTWVVATHVEDLDEIHGSCFNLNQL